MSITEYKINFEKLEWESPLHGVRFKRFLSGNKQVRLVEYSKDFVEPDWCRRGHVGYVIEGEIEIDFSGKAVSYLAGDAIFIPPGENCKHKAAILTERAVVFLVEDL